jgi:hypothetical protein
VRVCAGLHKGLRVVCQLTLAHYYPLGRLALSLPQFDFGAHSESCQTDGAAHAAASSCLALALVTLTLTYVQVPLVRHRLRPVLVLVLVL